MGEITLTYFHILHLLDFENSPSPIYIPLIDMLEKSHVCALFIYLYFTYKIWYYMHEKVKW